MDAHVQFRFAHDAICLIGRLVPSNGTYLDAFLSLRNTASGTLFFIRLSEMCIDP